MQNEAMKLNIYLYLYIYAFIYILYHKADRLSTIIGEVSGRKNLPLSTRGLLLDKAREKDYDN